MVITAVDETPQVTPSHPKSRGRYSRAILRSHVQIQNLTQTTPKSHVQKREPQRLMEKKEIPLFTEMSRYIPGMQPAERKQGKKGKGMGEGQVGFRRGAKVGSKKSNTGTAKHSGSRRKNRASLV